MKRSLVLTRVKSEQSQRSVVLLELLWLRNAGTRKQLEDHVKVWTVFLSVWSAVVSVQEPKLDLDGLDSGDEGLSILTNKELPLLTLGSVSEAN